MTALYAVRFSDDRWLGMDNRGAMATGYPCAISEARRSTFVTIDEAVERHSWARGLCASIGRHDLIPRRGTIERLEAPK